jgi:hypothetical protein
MSDKVVIVVVTSGFVEDVLGLEVVGAELLVDKIVLLIVSVVAEVDDSVVS